MLDYILKIIKRVFFACAILYSFDLLAPSKIFIPVNIYTVATISIFKLFGLMLLMIIKIFM